MYKNLDLFPFLNNDKMSKLELKLKSVSEDLTTINKKRKNLRNNGQFEEYLFEKINEYLIQTETLKKYSNFFLSAAELEKQPNAHDLPKNIFCLDSDLLDKLTLILVEKLSKSYELNEMFQDEVKDLAQFEKEELVRIQKRMKMKNDLFNLQKKHGESLNILFDDYKGATNEIKEDVGRFKSLYGEEIEAELDIKFKEVFKILIDKTPKVMHKYDSPEEFEKDKQYLEKFEQIQNKIMEEIRAKQKGTYEPKENTEEPPSPEDKKLEKTIRLILQRRFLGVMPAYGAFLPKYFDDDFQAEFNLLHLPSKVYKTHKIPEEEEKKAINRRVKRFYDVINYSKSESTVIPKERIEVITQRFLEVFGRYNSSIYPDGFRHLESFEMYQSVYPLKTMSEYISECN